MAHPVMVKAVFSLAILAAVYRSFKSLKAKQRDNSILQFWVIYALLCVFESSLEFLVRWIPFYFFIKFYFILAVSIPETKIANLLFHAVVVPGIEALHKQLQTFKPPTIFELVQMVPFYMAACLFPMLFFDMPMKAPQGVTVEIHPKRIVPSSLYRSAKPFNASTPPPKPPRRSPIAGVNAFGELNGNMPSSINETEEGNIGRQDWKPDAVKQLQSEESELEVLEKLSETSRRLSRLSSEYRLTKHPYGAETSPGSERTDLRSRTHTVLNTRDFSYESPLDKHTDSYEHTPNASRRTSFVSAMRKVLTGDATGRTRIRDSLLDLHTPSSNSLARTHTHAHLHEMQSNVCTPVDSESVSKNTYKEYRRSDRIKMKKIFTQETTTVQDREAKEKSQKRRSIWKKDSKASKAESKSFPVEETTDTRAKPKRKLPIRGRKVAQKPERK